MSRKKSPFDKMNEFLAKQNDEKQMSLIQKNDVSTYDKPDLFSQMDAMLQPKKPEKDYYAEAKVLRQQREQRANAANDRFAQGAINRPILPTPKAPQPPQERDGFLGFMDRFVVPVSKGATDFIAPGNTERMAQNDRRKYGSVQNPVINAAQKDRGLETDVLNTIGAIGAVASPYGRAYKGANWAFNKIPQLAKVTNPYAQRAIKGAMAGGTAEAGLAGVADWIAPEEIGAKDYAMRIGLGVAGGAVLDPAMYGIGRGMSKGFDTALQKLIPDQPLPEFTGSVRPEILDKIANTQRKLGIEPGSPIGTQQADNPQQILDQMLKESPLPTPDSVSKVVDNHQNVIKQRKLTDLQTKAESLRPNVEQYNKEYEEAVQTQYEYLKNSMGKGTQAGGLVRDQEGYVINAYGRVSNNPKWYQDFYAQHGRRPTNKELRELAEIHVREGFEDEVGELPAWSPSAVKEIDSQIDEIKALIDEQPDQEAALRPILEALEDDKKAVLQSLEQARTDYDGYTKQIKELEGTQTPQQPAKQSNPANVSKPLQEVKPVPKANTQESVPNVSEVPVNASQLDNNVMSYLQNNDAISPSKLQKELKVGYTEAVRIIDDLEAKGLVSSYEQNKPRTIFKDKINSAVNAVSEVPKNDSQPPLEQPENIPYVAGERKHYSTLANSEKAPDEFIDGIKKLDRKISNSLSDKEAADFANAMIERDIEEAFQFVKNVDIRDKRHVTVGARLIDEFNKTKQFERAVDMADLLAREGTKAGQKLQSFSLYNRLTVEGQLIRAQRRVIKLNETLPEGKKITLTPEIADDIAVAADSIQKLTGQEEIGNSVISLLDKAKKGNTLTDEELNVVRSFMSDAKKFVGDLDANAKPQKVKPVKNVRARDKVIEIMDKREQHAKEELKKIFGRANALPVDAFYYLAEIGAAKIAKGTIKFADFSEQMIKEIGEEIRPYMQQIYNKAVETFNLETDKISAKSIAKAEKLVNKAIADKTLSQAEAAELIGLTKKLVTATGDMKFEASMHLQIALNKLEQPTFAQMLSSAHIQSMLSGTLTVMRNIIGNEVFYRTDRVSKLITVPIDIARSKITGTNRTIAFNTGQFQDWKSFINPTKDYAKGLKIGAKAGYQGTNPLGLNTAYDIKSPAFSSKYSNMGLKELLTTKDKSLNLPMRLLTSKFSPLHWTEKVLGVTLRSFDTAGYMRAYSQALREQATLKAMNEGLKGKALREAAEKYFLQADENMIAIAEEYGKYATFQDSTPLSRGLTKAKEEMNKYSTMALSGGLAKTKEFGVGSFIIPFPKTPGNLIMRSLEYSPAGLIRSINYLYNYWRVTKNPLELREGQLALGRAIMGTAGFSGFGFILADKGVLTSSGHSDYEVKALERMAGKQPNSVNVTAIQRFIFGGFDLKDLDLQEGDTFYSYDWMQPISLSVSLGTGINQAHKESEDPAVSEQLIKAGDSAANTVINMSALSGVNRLVSGPPNESWSEKFAGSLASAGSSFVPTIINQARRITDNTAKNTNAPTFREKAQNMAINRLPHFNKNLPPAYNTFGEPREVYPGGSNNAFNVYMNPAFVSQYKPTEEIKLLMDYINRTGDKTAAPPLAPKSIMVEGEDKKLSKSVKLTGEEQSEYQRIVGEEIKKRLKSNLETLKRADDDRIEKLIDDIYREAGDKAREAIRAGRRE